MRALASLVLVCAATGSAGAISELEYVPAYVKECPGLSLVTTRYEQVLVATLAPNSNGIKGIGETKSRILPGIYIEPGQRDAFCRDVLADYGPAGRKVKGLVRKK